MAPTPVLLPGKSHGWRSLVGCSPWGCEESDTTERFHFHFSLSCIGEGNGNPLQCSCLENPRDGEAWWTAVYGAAQSRTRLKRLNSSMCIYIYTHIYICHKILFKGKNHIYTHTSFGSFLRKDFLGLPYKKWHPTPVLLPGKSHEQRSLVGCIPWGP